jgi:hypothetical protein
VEQLTDATSKLANRAALFVQTRTRHSLTRVTGQSESDMAPYVDGFFEIAEGTMNGLSIIYGELRQAAKTLASSITNNSILIIEHW